MRYVFALAFALTGLTLTAEARPFPLTHTTSHAVKLPDGTTATVLVHRRRAFPRLPPVVEIKQASAAKK